MPQIIVSRKATDGINRCLAFLIANEAAAVITDVKNKIADSLENLEKGLLTGTSREGENFYLVVVPFGNSGYEYSYLIDDIGKYIISGFRHQRENDDY